MAKSKVGTKIHVKGHTRKVGKLPPRAKNGKFTGSKRRKTGGSGGQTTLFK